MKRLKTTLIAVAILAVGVGGGLGLAYLQAPKPLNAVQSSQTQATVNQAKLLAQEAERQRVAFTTANLTRFTNEERVKAGLPPVTENPILNASAQAKAQDMADRNYWSHDSPDGVEPWSFIKAQGYNYSFAGENLACGWENSEKVTKGWMASPSHKVNIVKPEYTQVGYGIVEANSYTCGNFPRSKQTIIVQHFATPY